MPSRVPSLGPQLSTFSQSILDLKTLTWLRDMGFSDLSDLDETGSALTMSDDEDCFGK